MYGDLTCPLDQKTLQIWKRQFLTERDLTVEIAWSLPPDATRHVWRARASCLMLDKVVLTFVHERTADDEMHAVRWKALTHTRGEQHDTTMDRYEWEFPDESGSVIYWSIQAVPSRRERDGVSVSTSWRTLDAWLCESIQLSDAPLTQEDPMDLQMEEPLDLQMGDPMEPQMDETLDAEAIADETTEMTSELAEDWQDVATDWRTWREEGKRILCANLLETILKRPLTTDPKTLTWEALQLATGRLPGRVLPVDFVVNKSSMTMRAQPEIVTKCSQMRYQMMSATTTATYNDRILGVTGCLFDLEISGLSRKAVQAKPIDGIRTLIERAVRAKWAPSSLKTNTGHVMSLLKQLMMPIPPEWKAFSTLAERGQTAWAEYQAGRRRMTEAEASEVRAALIAADKHDAALVLHIAYALAQRVGDVVRLCGLDINTEEGICSTVSITVYRGKRASTRAFALWVPRDSALAQELLSWQLAMLRQGTMTKQFGRVIARQVSEAISQLNERQAATNAQPLNWDQVEPHSVLSVRRGALTRWACLGLPESSLLRLSQHRDPVTLRRYLADGRFLLAEAKPIIDIWQELPQM